MFSVILTMLGNEIMIAPVYEQNARGRYVYLPEEMKFVKFLADGSISEEVLEKGVGHVEGTSLPIGGASTHAVLAGHRGLPSAKIFTDLDQMKNGDIFLIHVLGKTLAYKVDQIKTVLPEESSELDIIEGEDHVTLVTCTPYGVNTHRLLIRGIRTEYVEPEEAEETPIQQIAKVDPVKIMIIGLVAMVIMIIIVYIVIRRKNRKTEESSRKDE